MTLLKPFKDLTSFWVKACQIWLIGWYNVYSRPSTTVMEIGWQLGLILYQTYTDHLICGAKARDCIKICIKALDAWKTSILFKCDRKKETLTEARDVAGFHHSRSSLACKDFPLFLYSNFNFSIKCTHFNKHAWNKNTSSCCSWFLWRVDVKISEKLKDIFKRIH